MLTSLLVLTFLAGDPDPEPPASPLTKLQGKWQVGSLLGKKPTAVQTYEFDKGKVTVGRAKGPPLEMKVAADKKLKDVIVMTPEKGGRTTRYFFKLEKDRLYLSPIPPDEPDPKPDFSGGSYPVLLLTREKK